MSWFGWGAAGPQAGDVLEYPELASPTSSAEYEALLEKTFSDMCKLGSNNEGWNRVPLTQPELADVELHDREVPGSVIQAVKIIGVIPAAPENLVKLLSETTDVAIIKNWEVDILTMKIHAQITDSIFVSRTTYYAPYPLTHRDFVVASTVGKVPEGGFAIVQSSINSKDFRYDPNFVRGVLSIAGYLLQPVQGKPDATRLIRITQIDPKGNIPAMIVNSFKTKAANNFHLLRQYVTANPLK